MFGCLTLGTARQWHQATTHTLVAREHRLDLRRAPLLMGILNATPDSFSDGGRPDMGSTRADGLELLAAAPT